MTDTQPPPDLPSSWNSEDADAVRSDGKNRRTWIIGGIVVVILVIVGAIAIVNLIAGEERAWPASLAGRPEGLGGEKETAADVTPSAEPGVYIWNSFDGWHLWVVNGEEQAGLTGTITSNQDLVGAVSSAPDDGTITLDGKTIEFDLAEGAAVAGVDFDPGFAKELTFDLERGGVAIPADQVFLGAKLVPADRVPVVIEKAVVD